MTTTFGPPPIKKPAPKKTAMDFIAIAIGMLEKEQTGKAASRENRKALNALKDAKKHLDRKHLNRKKG